MSASGSFGSALGKTTELRKNMRYGGIFLNYNQFNKNDYQFNIGSGISFIGYDYLLNNQNAYRSLMFVKFPVSLRKYASFSNHALFFIEFGGYLDWCIYQQQEFFLLEGISSKTNFPNGINYGLLTKVGCRFPLNNKSSIDVSLCGDYDLGSSFKNSLDKITFTKQIVNISYNVKLKYK